MQVGSHLRIATVEAEESLMSARQAMLGLLTISLMFSCTDAGLQLEPPPPPQELDNLLRVKGDFCTEPSAEVSFPIKVLFVVDQSASLQCTDSQNRRFNALNTAVDELRSQPNTELAFIGFSSWSRSIGFTRNRDEMSPFLDPSGGLGPATDYQGALATGLQILEQDMINEGPAVRARSKYVVVFVSDGVPEPRCNPGCEDDTSNCSDGDDNDGDGRTDGADVDCTDIGNNSLHPDNLYGVCNTDEEVPDDIYVDMTGICPEYNQPPQIMQRVQEIVDLKETYAVGDVTVNTILLFSPQDVVEGICPGAAAAFGYDRAPAQAMLQAMANTGNGIYRDVNLASQEDSFLTFDITSMKAEQILVGLLATNLNGRRYKDPNALAPDGDQDGIVDEQEFALGTDREGSDTDDDNYSDLFELVLKNSGFDPKNPGYPAVKCPDRRDADGDLLDDCEEMVLGTNFSHPDTDGDNITDWVEMIYGTDPTHNDALQDLDFDGISNLDEIKGGTNPLVSDEDVFREYRIMYGLADNGIINFAATPEDTPIERHCYDFDISRIPLAVTTTFPDRGKNRIFIYAHEGPARVSGVPGEVKVACFDLFFQGGNAKEPADGVINVTQRSLDGLAFDLEDSVAALVECPYFADLPEVRRNNLQAMMAECMKPKIELNRRLYSQDEVNLYVVKYLSGDLVPQIPLHGHDLFVPLSDFDESQCYRPWELERLQAFLKVAEEACYACVDVPVETVE